MLVEDKLESLKELISKIEICLKCYNKYKIGTIKKELSLENGVTKDLGFFHLMKKVELKVSL